MNFKLFFWSALIGFTATTLVACNTLDRYLPFGKQDDTDISNGSMRLVMPDTPKNLPAIKDTLEIDTRGTLSFPTTHTYDFSVLINDYPSAPELKGLGHLYLPENISKPVPAMIILHGSGGIKSGREHEYAELFAKNGIAGFVVDYYSPRGVTEDTPYLMKTMIATEIDVLVDAYEALNFISTHPGIDSRRIGAIGFSYGGMATRYALDHRVAKILSPQGNRFAVHADFYGPCHQIIGGSESTQAPYLAVFGDQDNSVHPETCQNVHADIKKSGSPTHIHIIEGAGHAWENDQPRRESPSPYIRGCEFSFDQTTGDLLIDGKPTLKVETNTDLDTRMNIRAQLSGYVQHCLKQGYIIGKDIETDRKAKAILMKFLSENL